MRLSLTGRVICTHQTDRGGGWGQAEAGEDGSERTEWALRSALARSRPHATKPIVDSPRVVTTGRRRG
jgi:hypothetical protein